MNALKEWATVVNALENGKQTVILRKGGILETASGFKVEAKKFLLFPTWEHQEEKHVKPEFQNFLNEALKNKPKDGFNRITSFVESLDEKDIESKETIHALSPFHVWSDAYIEERINWMPEKPIKAVFLVEINSNFDSGQPVLNDLETESALQKFRGVVNEV